jgi:xylulokinase
MHALDALVQSVPCGCDGLAFLPFFIRQRGSRRLSRSPRRILRRAAFHHAGPFRPQRDGIRRVSAAGLFRHAERLGCPADTVYSLGGGARSAVWQQIKADACGRTFRVPACSEATAMGAALLAGGAADSSPRRFPLPR